MAIAASAILFFWGLWSLPILSLNEGRRMVVVREMLAGSNWLLPTLGGKVYLMKPPLFYWVAASIGLLFRSSAEWVVRLPSAVSAFLVTWLTYYWAKKYISRWAALFSALILITAYKFSLYARRGEIEMLLTLCCTLAAFLFWDFLKSPQARSRLYLSYALWGLAFLTKGPAALPYFAPPLLLFWLLTRDRNVLRGLLSLRGWALLALVALPWYIYTYLNLGGGRWESFLERDLLGKTFWSRARDPLYSYPLEMVINFSPWMLILFYRTKGELKSLFSRRETLFCFAWALVPFLLFSACATKHAKYILPLFPAVSILLGTWMASAYARLKTRFGAEVNRVALLTVATLLAGWVLFYSVGEPVFLNYRYCAIPPLLQKIQETGGEAPVFSYRHKYERLIYYYQKPIRTIHQKGLKKRIKRQESFLLIAEDRNWKELEGQGLCVLAEVRPFLHRNRAARLYATPDFCKSR
ncbi:MAG: glycosyltransferase family 39 protein [candidate division NC10 bacterium]|nr:glycosyltransferase family 39 protein [candidate division NC10 bacterium]